MPRSEFRAKSCCSSATACYWCQPVKIACHPFLNIYIYTHTYTDTLLKVQGYDVGYEGFWKTDAGADLIGASSHFLWVVRKTTGARLVSGAACFPLEGFNPTTNAVHIKLYRIYRDKRTRFDCQSRLPLQVMHILDKNSTIRASASQC